jgi:hypothetical protein
MTKAIDEIKKETLDVIERSKTLNSKDYKDLEERAQELMNDGNQEKWENGELGQSEEHAVVPTP